MEDGRVEGEHKVIITKPRGDDSWIATCSCGWVGPQRLSYRQAFADEDEHQRGVETEGSL